MPTQPGLATLQDVIRVVRQRSDTVNSPYVTDAELTDYIQLAYGNMYDLLIEKYAENYPNSTPYVFTTDGTNSQYPLPQDFYKKIGLDIQYSGGPQGWVTVHDDQFMNRNRYSLPFAIWPQGFINYRSRLLGNTLLLMPVPAGGAVFRLWYAPRLITLALSGTIALNQVTNGDTFTLNPNYAPAIQNPNGNVVVPQGNPVTLTAGSSFTVTSGNMVATALALATAFNASTLSTTYGLVAQANSGTPTVTIYLPSNGTTVSWSSSNANHFQLNQPLLWGNIFDTISGWHKLVIIDAALSVLSKEESDCSQLNLERAQEVARIESAAAIRSPDEPDHVVDVARRGWQSFTGYGYGGYGGED